MTLLEKQLKFSEMTVQLLQHLLDYGFKFKFGHALRCVDCKTGKANSLHKSQLAIDILLFTADNEWLTETQDYEWLGRYWESLGGSWGGRFKLGDGNHFSLEHNGMK
jgi:hypothetical protein